VLKAYSYNEGDTDVSHDQDDGFMERQRKLATQFLKEEHVGVETRVCPSCGEQRSGFFAVISSIEYRSCERCQSIFASVSKDTAARYRAYKPLIEFKQAKDFQENAQRSRRGSWEDLLRWIQFRCARFLGYKEDLSVVDIDNIYDDLSNLIKDSDLCDRYTRTQDLPTDHMGADVALYIDHLREDSDPAKSLTAVRNALRPGGLLFLTARLGTGFDILTLKGSIHNVFPCEHLFLPSAEGLMELLAALGFEVLEFFTPGNLDVEQVMRGSADAGYKSSFIQYLLYRNDPVLLHDFQRFLQKNGLSSHARIIARRAD